MQAESVAAAVALHRTIVQMNENNAYLSEELLTRKKAVGCGGDVQRYAGAVAAALGAAVLQGL